MGKPVQSGASQKQDVPKYMCLNGRTQYELAQSIDAAMTSAESAVKANQEQEALFLWYEQVLDGIHENFLLQKNVKSVENNDVLVAVISELMPLCWAYYHANPTSGSPVSSDESNQKYGFQTLMTGLLEHSFMNALDILHARNLWRFDIQRSMQQTQERIMKGVQDFIAG